jgi:5-hydroxyisourate hydrolase-like protein (transthyretin family)
MRGKTIETDDRGVSEIYGTVLIISLAFVTAILIIGLGAFIVDDLQNDTEDTLSEDAMKVMNDRMAEVSASSVNASQEFMFPEGEGDVEANPDDGNVTITVKAANRDADFLVANTTSKTHSISLGTVTHRGEGGTTTVSQGGGLFKEEQGVTSVSSPPQLNYDGNRLSLGFTNLTSADQIRQGREMTVTSNADSSVATSKAIQESIQELWTIETEQFGKMGTDQVDVTVTINSSVAEGWADYAKTAMDVRPSNNSNFDILQESDDQVTLAFYNLGTPLESDYFSKPADWEDERVIYAGNSSLAPFNDAIEQVDDGFVINNTYAEENETVDEAANLNSPQHSWDFAIFDKTAMEFVVASDEDEWWFPEAHPSGERQWAKHGIGGNDYSDRIDRLEKQLGEDWITDADDADLGDLEDDAGEYVYDFKSYEAICILSDEPNLNSMNYEDISDPCSSLLGMADDPRDIIEGPEFLVSNSSVDASNPVVAGDSVGAEATITNVGDQAANESLLLKVEDGTGTGPTVDGTKIGGTVVAETKPSEHGDGLLGLEESRNVTFDWSPTEGELASIYEALDDDQIEEVSTGVYHLKPEATVLSGSDYEVAGDAGEVVLEYKPPQDIDFQIDSADVEIGGTDIEDVDKVSINNDQVTADVTVTNRGTGGGTGAVTLWYDNGNNAPAASTSLSLDAGETDTVSMTWSMESVDHSLGEIDLHITAGDDYHGAGSANIKDPADFHVDIVESKLEDGLVDETVPVNVTVSNKGEAMGSDEIELYVDGQNGGDPVDTVSVNDMAGGTDREVQVTWSDLETGDHDITVRSEDSGRTDEDTVTVHPMVTLDDVTVNGVEGEKDWEWDWGDTGYDFEVSVDYEYEANDPANTLATDPTAFISIEVSTTNDDFNEKLEDTSTDQNGRFKLTGGDAVGPTFFTEGYVFDVVIEAHYDGEVVDSWSDDVRIADDCAISGTFC